jgi:CBS domain-containing protein
MKTLSDIMVNNVVSVKNTDSIHHARNLLKEKNIRHLPVVDAVTGDFAGVLSQRGLLNHAFKTVEKYGISYLEKMDKQTAVSEVMVVDCVTAQPDMELLAAGEFFTAKKSSCLPVVDGNRLVGIITSVDFVKLALHLLARP